MEKIASENLFLMEFLVDHVTLDPCCDCVAPGGEKCVSFQFLDNAPLDVCEADFAPQRNYGSKCPRDTNVKSGKSCLFSMSGSQVEYCMEKFDIYVTIFKKMQPGWLPEKVEIGFATVPIVKLFCDLIASLTQSTRGEGTAPTAKTMKDEFDIGKISGDIVGRIGVYIRMSCFGKLIVTQFQMNLQDKSVLFKDKEGKSLYRYKKAPKPCCPPACPPKCTPCCPPNPCCPPACPPPGCCAPPPCPRPCPTSSAGDISEGCCPPPACCPPPSCCPPPPQFPPGCCPPGCPPPSCCPPPACPPPPCPTCCCSPPPCPPPSCPKCCPPACPPPGCSKCCPYAPPCPPPGNNMNMSMSPGIEQQGEHLPFAFKMGSSGTQGAGNQVVVNPPVSITGGAQVAEFSDPNKELFVLRIGKKSEGADKKQTLELELCTPKGPELKPIPRKETRDTQCDSKDTEGAGGKKGGGKKRR